MAWLLNPMILPQDGISHAGRDPFSWLLTHQHPLGDPGEVNGVQDCLEYTPAEITNNIWLVINT